MIFSPHPALHRLHRVAVDEASPLQRQRVMRHLARCKECRARYHWLASLPTRLELATAMAPPDDAEDAILASRAAGERVILPIRDGTSAVRPNLLARFAVPVVSVLAVSVIGWLVWGTSAGANQSGGTLVFEPSTLPPQGAISVSYRPGRDLRGESAVVLRGILTSTPRYDVPRPEPRQLAVLQREGSAYRGELHVGTAAVYGQVVVEDQAGTYVDDRGGLRWHLYAQEDGVPIRDALWAHALLAGSWQDAHQALKRVVELYPADPRMRASKLAYELSTFTAVERDSALAFHGRVLGTIENRLQADELHPGTLAGLVEYARTIGDERATEHWKALLVERYPRHPETVWYRVPEPPLGGTRDEVSRYLVDLEALWQSAGPHPALAPAGLWAARQLPSTSPVLTWARRQIENPGWGDGGTAVPLLLARTPAVRDSVPAYLRAEIRRLDELRTPRPLDRTADAHARQVRLAVRPLLVALADVLEEGGERTAALDTLRVAAGIGWSSSVHARLAEMSLAMGDTIGAAESLARAAASFGRDAELDSALALGRTLVSGYEWELLERAARDAMHRHVLGRSTHLPRPRGVRVFGADGREHDLEKLRGGTAMLVAFWDPRSAPALADLPELSEVARVIRRLGGEVALVTRSPWAQRQATLERVEGTDLPLFYDVDREATEAFRAAWAPEYYVLGLNGRIRFADIPLEDAVGQIDALLNEPRLTIVQR